MHKNSKALFCASPDHTLFICHDVLIMTKNQMTHVKTCLTHWGRVTHICVSKLAIIGSDNGLVPDRRKAIIWTIAVLLLIGPLGTNFSEILIEILASSFKEMRLKVWSAKWRPFCLGLNVFSQVTSQPWSVLPVKLYLHHTWGLYDQSGLFQTYARMHRYIIPSFYYSKTCLWRPPL